jgi:hypothetical protein
MADLYGDAIGGGVTGNIDANARRLLGDGSAGVGPYTSFGTPKLQALKIISATINFTTTPTVANSNLYKAVSALQGLAEIYYVGIPTASGANQFVALVNYNNADNGNGYATYGSDDESFENIEDAIGAALGTAENDVTVTKSVLTGLSFN